MPIGSSPSQASATRISKCTGYCSEYHTAKLNKESKSFESFLKRVILSNSIRPLLRVWSGSQEDFGGRNAPTCARKERSFVEISANQDVEPAELKRMLTFSSCRHDLILLGVSKFFLVNWWPLDDVDIHYFTSFQTNCIADFFVLWNRLDLHETGKCDKLGDVIDHDKQTWLPWFTNAPELAILILSK